MKKLIGYLLIAAILFGGWYFLSPPLALKGLRDAAAAHDADAVIGYIDLPALRASLKSQVKERLEEEAASKTGLEAVGMQLGMTVADPVIDLLLTEENVTRMVEQQTLTGAALAASSGASGASASEGGQTDKAEEGSAISGSSTEAAALPAETEKSELDFDLERVSLDEFRVAAKDNPAGGQLIFTRHGIGWKLSGMELPKGSIFPR